MDGGWIREQVVTNFSGEKMESVVFLLVGGLALAAAALLWRSSGFHRGIAVPLALVAVIQIIVGGTIYSRTGAQVASLEELLDRDPDRFAAEEAPRMDRVMRGFRIYKSVEIVLLLAGLALVVFVHDRGFWYGAGTGLIIQSALMLVMDVIAERRGASYLEEVRQLLQ